jgi:hypothetical protein
MILPIYPRGLRIWQNASVVILAFLIGCIGRIAFGYGLLRRSKIQGADLGLIAKFSTLLGIHL